MDVHQELTHRWMDDEKNRPENTSRAHFTALTLIRNKIWEKISRHRGAKDSIKCELFSDISLLSKE